LVVDSGVVSPSEIALTLLPDTTTNETIYLTNPYTDKSLNFRIVKDADYVYDYSEITPLFDFIWQDIKEGGTAVAVPLNSNAEIIGTSYAIGFDFPFYGSSFQRVWLSTIGGILLDTEISGRNLTDDLAKLPYTTYFPKSTGPGNMIAAYLDGDIKADEQSALFVKQVDADTFVIQCENFTYHPRSGDSWTMALDESMRMTWQVHLKRSGDVFFYLKEHAVASDGKTNDEFSIGLQNADGSQGLEVFRANAFYLRGFPLDQSYTPHDQLGIHIRAPQDWFAYSQQDITVPPAGQAQVILSLDAQGLGDGETLSATVRVQTDDETLNAIPLQIALQIDDTNHAVASEINALTPYKQARAHGDVVNGYYNSGSIGLDKSNVGYNVPSSFQWKNFVVFDVSALLDDLSAASSIRFSTNYSWGGGGSLGWRHVFLGAYDDADFTDALMRYSGMGDDLRFEMAGTLLGMADPDNGGVNYAADYDVADLVRASVDPSHPYLWFRVEGAGHPGAGVDASGAISNPTLEITVPAFEVWKRGQELPNGIGTPDSDEDSDGRSLAEEFLMGGDPAVADNPITEFQFFVGTLSGQNYMDFQFPVREGSEGSYSFEYSANLNAWNPVMLTDLTGASPEVPATGFIIKRYRLIPTEESETGHFLRMRLEP
jgi:hypothetical protein